MYTYYIVLVHGPSDSINELQKYTSALVLNLPAAATSPAVRHPRSVKYFFKYCMYILSAYAEEFRFKNSVRFCSTRIEIVIVIIKNNNK